MAKIVLVSDDSDFFEFIKIKLELRKSDELFTFSFDSIVEKIHFLHSALIIINSEGTKEKTLQLLSLLKGLPTIVCAYNNDDDVFRRKCYRAGMFDFITLLIPDADFKAKLLPALAVCSLLEKNENYRKILVNDDILEENIEVYKNHELIIDNELKFIHSGIKKAVFVAISPSDKTKFLISPSVLETLILNNIRINDILMNYAPNKYFLFMFNTDITSAKKTWQKVSLNLQQKVYAGFVNVSNQKRQQLINEALNRLHEAINADRGEAKVETPKNSSLISTNFKMFRQDFARKIEQIILPVFYQIEQKYTAKLSNVSLDHENADNFGAFYIRGAHYISSLKITCPGFSRINIDINISKDSKIIDSKRISLEPDELDSGLLSDLLEQFILEYKKGYEL